MNFKRQITNFFVPKRRKARERKVTKKLQEKNNKKIAKKY